LVVPNAALLVRLSDTRLLRIKSLDEVDETFGGGYQEVVDRVP
jgi:hypothetical protein